MHSARISDLTPQAFVIAIAGHSGAGKSTLIERLLVDGTLSTEEIADKIIAAIHKR